VRTGGKTIICFKINEVRRKVAVDIFIHWTILLLPVWILQQRRLKLPVSRLHRTSCCSFWTSCCERCYTNTASMTLPAGDLDLLPESPVQEVAVAVSVSACSVPVADEPVFLLLFLRPGETVPRESP